MKRFAAALSLAWLWALAALPAQAGEAQRIVIVDYGLYEHSVITTVPEPRHVSGERIIVSGVRLLRSADEIDAQLGRMIGFQFRVADPALVGRPLTLRRLVPPLTNPKTGVTAQIIDRDMVVTRLDDVWLNAYRFDHAWEMAEGLWRFQVIHDGVVIAEKAIKVIVPLN